MTTTVNFDLSSTLTTTLSGSGTYAYAFAFGASELNGPMKRVGWTTLVDNGVAVTDPSLSLPSTTFFSGQVYVVIQQNGFGGLPNFIKDVAALNPDHSYRANFSYQLYEMTLSGSDQDQGDISAVNTFGFASTLEVEYQSGSVTRGFNTSASEIFSALPAAAVVDFHNNHFPDPERLASGPATANNNAPWPSSGWTSYVNALAANPTALSDIEIVYAFQGGSGVLSQYSVQYVANGTYGSDYFWLVPDNSNGATNTDFIRIPASQLAENIFVQGGQLEYHAGSKSASAQYYTSFTPTNADGGVAKHFVAGFDAGFWGGSGASPNSLVTEAIDFNKGYNWSVGYAYDAVMLDGVGAASYTNSLGTSSSGNFFYDPWAQQFVAESNAYGYSYSDLVSAGGVNPQVSMWDPQANSGAGANVATVNITLYDNSETPASGYTASGTGYIAPTAASGNYEDSLTQTSNQLGFDFAFSVGTPIFAPDDATPIKFKIYAPDSPQADGDGFIVLDVTAAGGTNGNWCYYSIVENAGTWSLQFDNTTGANGQGQFNISGLPATSDGSPSWYQLVFGAGDDQSIYNIYATTDPSNSNVFTNVVVDHGVEVTEYSSSDYGLDFAPGGHMLYDIDTFSAPPTGDPNAVGVTIVGSKKTDFVNALNSVAGQQGPTNRADTIFGGKGDDRLSGLAGNDTIDGGSGVDIVRGNDGDDILQVRGNEGTYDFFHGGAGTDTLQFLDTGSVTLSEFDASVASIEILQGNGQGLIGTKQLDVFDLSGLTAMTGLPFIDAQGGNDIVTGSTFADDLRGGQGDDTLNGNAGNDTLNGGKGVDVLRGGADDDTLQVRDNEGIGDTFDGGSENDTLQLLGAVTLAGFNATAASIEILQGSGRGLTGTNLGDVFDLSGLSAMTGVLFIDARSGDDTLIGSGFADDLRGDQGNDTLEGRAGNDILNGGKGADTLLGGADDDILQVRGDEGMGDTFDGGTGTDTLQLIGAVTLAGFNATASSIEILQGSGKGVNGTEQADVFNFSGLTATSGVQLIDARGGNDTLIGSNFADTLRGGNGDDTLDGRGGNDFLDGGSGANTYVFADGYGADTVVRYNVDQDKFDLTGVTGVSSFGDLVLTQIDRKTVLIDFGGGNTLTIQKTTIDILTANQSDFLF